MGRALGPFQGEKQLEREPTDPMDRKAWLTISVVTVPAVGCLNPIDSVVGAEVDEMDVEGLKRLIFPICI